MQTPVADDRPPRFYQLALQPDLLGGWSLVREWGNQGAGGRVMKDHFATYEEAEAALLRHREAQLERGYRVVFTQGQERPR